MTNVAKHTSPHPIRRTPVFAADGDAPLAADVDPPGRDSALREVPPGQPPLAELHEGVTDVYGGEGELIVGGEMQDVREVRPGEQIGTMTTGRRIPVTKGSIVNIPPNTSHATVPGSGGLQYVLQKVNVGMYPWSLINGAP